MAWDIASGLWLYSIGIVGCSMGPMGIWYGIWRTWATLSATKSAIEPATVMRTTELPTVVRSAAALEAEEVEADETDEVDAADFCFLAEEDDERSAANDLLLLICYD